MKRVFLFVALGLLLAIGAAVWLGLSRLDEFVASAIEELGSEISGVPVRVGLVEIELAEGRGTIAGLRAGNPTGLSSGDVFTLGEITLDIDTASITWSPIVIDVLTVAAPVVLYEMNAEGRSNIDVMRDNVKRYSKAADSANGGPQQGSGGDSQEGEEVRLAVTKFRFEDGSMTAGISALRADVEAQTLEAPSVSMGVIGGSEGVSPGELGATVLGVFTKSL